MSDIKRFDFDTDEACTRIRFGEMADGTYALFSDIELLQADAINAAEANTAIRAERDAYRELSVTQILLSVTPGPDGMGQENYATSVADVVAKFGELSDEIEAKDERIAELQTKHDEQQLLAVVRLADISDCAAYGDKLFHLLRCCLPFVRDRCKETDFGDASARTTLALVEAEFKRAELDPKSEHCIPCQGSGTVGTGIAEASSTICNKCDGTGRRQ